MRKFLPVLYGLTDDSKFILQPLVAGFPVLYIYLPAHITPNVESVLDQCWATVCDVGPTLNEHRFRICFQLSIYIPSVHCLIHVIISQLSTGISQDRRRLVNNYIHYCEFAKQSVHLACLIESVWFILCGWRLVVPEIGITCLSWFIAILILKFLIFVPRIHQLG